MATQRCTSCNRSASVLSSTEHTPFQLCGGCKQVRYCSRGCQKADWKYHKLVCKQHGEFMVSTTRPSQLHKLALVFPVDAESPEFRWIEFEQILAGPDSWENPIHQPHLGPADSNGEVYFTRHDVSRLLHLKFSAEPKYDLDHSVIVYVRENWLEDGSKLNQGIDKMMKGSQPVKFRGPMLAFSLPTTGIDPPFFQDFNPADIRVVANFLELYGGPRWSDVGSGFVALSGETLRQFSNFSAN